MISPFFTKIVLVIQAFFVILGKFGAVFASIPAPMVAALYCLFFAYVGMTHKLHSRFPYQLLSIHHINKIQKPPPTQCNFYMLKINECCTHAR